MATLSDFFAKILRWGIFVSLFIPLIIFSQYLSPFHFGKMVIFRILVEIMAVFYIPLMLADKQYRPKWSLILKSFSIFTALYVITGLVGVNTYNSFWGSLERMGGIFSFIHFWVYFLILVSMVKKEFYWDKILKVSTLVGFLSILFAYGQRFIRGSFFVGWQHGERLIGTIGNPALFGGYLLFVLFLAIFFLFKKGLPKWQKWFFVLVIILGVPVLMMTAVRGAIIAFWGSLFLLALFLVFKSESPKLKKYLFAGIIIFVVLVVVIGLSTDQDWVKNNSILKRISDISLSTDTIQTRLWSWGSGIKGWLERPILGWGPENFMYLHMKYFNPQHFTGFGAETIWDRAHNMPLEILSTMGILGLLSYLSIFFFIFYFLFKKLKEGKITRNIFGVLSAMIIAYIVQNLFIFDTTANYLMFFLVLAYINFLNSREVNSSADLSAEARSAKAEVQPSKDPSIVLTAFLIIAALVVIFQLNIKPTKANFASTRAIITGRSGDVNNALNYYRKALNYNTAQGAYEIRHKLANFIVQVVENQRANGKEIDSALFNVLDYGIKELEKNIGKYSQDTSPYLYLGRMYILLIGKDAKYGDLAETNIKKAVDINNKNPRIWYELGQAQLSQEKYQDAYRSFKTALDLNPDVVVSHWFIGMAAYQLGNSIKDKNLIVEAVTEIEKSFSMGYTEYKDSLSDLNRLIEVYEKIKAYPRLIQFYKLAINLRPKIARYYAGLAQAYAETKNYQGAREEALKALELEPKLKEVIDKFLKSLPE